MLNSQSLVSHTSSFVFAVLICTILFSYAIASNIVDLPLGRVNGVACSEFPNVIKYLGIPYGLPPIGKLRYSPPLAYNMSYPEPYLNATSNPLECAQNSLLGDTENYAGMSEDCLYLSIWSPANASRGSLPVRVYIHGGAFHAGSTSLALHDGCSSVSHSNTVFVQMQYRLGSFGFLAHPMTYNESGTTGVWGILDQQLALRWVKKNIEAFGGDTSKVLLNGQSAGAWSVAIHLAIPGSSDLFTSAIVQSAPAVPLATPKKAYTIVKQFSTNLGCANASLEDELECIRGFSMESLLQAEPSFSLLYVSDPDWQVFFPIVDGHVIPSQLLESFSLGNFNKVPVMMGFDMNEGNQPVSMAYPDSGSITYNDILNFLQNIRLGGKVDEILNAYSSFVYLEGNPYYQLFSAMWTDIFIACPMFNMLSSIHQYGVPVYAYDFLHTPACPKKKVFMGAYHGVEEYYVFDHVEMSDSGFGTSDECFHTPEEKSLAGTLVDVWKNMAAHGKPKFIDGSVWQNWDDAQRFTFIEAGNFSTQAIDFASKCALLSSLLPEDEKVFIE